MTGWNAVPRVVRVLAPNPGVYTLEGTNTWIVGDRPAIVIDPGPDDPGHLQRVREEAGPPGVAAIFVTHGHPDHAPGSAALSQATGAPVYSAGPTGERDFGISDGDQFVFGDVRVETVHTPGHTEDHYVFFVGQARALFTGDMVLGRGTSVIDPPEGDLVKYLRSLARMRDLGARVIYPGHGPAVFDAHAKLGEYLAHRAEREKQILAVLSEDPATIDDLVSGIYLDYPAEVLPLAARSVLAHLEKLMSEDRVERRRRQNQDRYSVIPVTACARCGKPVRGRATLCGRCSLAVLQEGPPPSLS